MARFKFTLQTLLDRREQIEQDRQRELAAVQSVMTALQQELKALNDSMQTSIGDLRAGKLIGRLDLQFLAAHRRYVLSVERRAMTLAQRMAIQQRAVDEARARLVAVARDRKMLEKLRDKRKSAFIAEQGRKEFAELDDAISRLSASEQAAHAADVMSISAAVAEEPVEDTAGNIAEEDESVALPEAPQLHAGLRAAPEEPA
jgi:flagellar protein FliJ